MEVINQFIKDYGLAISTLLLILTLVFKLVSMVAKKLGFRKIAKVTDTLSTLSSVIRTNMQTAETMFDDGVVKLEYVMTKVEKWCIDNNEEFNEEKIKKEIEEEIALSKCVNYDSSKDEVNPDL